MPTKLTPDKLTGPQKAAVFLLAMGEDYAEKVFKEMSDDEIKITAVEMSKIDHITPDVMNKVMEDYVKNLGDDNRLIIGGESFTRNVVTKAMDAQRANVIITEINELKRDRPFVWSANVDPDVLGMYIAEEHPQTVAMILTQLPAEVASEILTKIPEDRKGDIALRIAQLGQIPDEIVRDVDEALRSGLTVMGKSSGGQTGGVQKLVEILNGVDKRTEDLVMESIEEEQGEMASDIKAMMFIFEDIINVDDKGMREILKKIESSQLVLALKTASEAMQEKIFSNLSSRAADMMKEDLDVMGPVRLSEVEEAQQAIANVAKDLEAEGTIMIGGKGKGEVLV